MKLRYRDRFFSFIAPAQQQLSLILVKLDHKWWRKCFLFFPLMSFHCFALVQTLTAAGQKMSEHACLIQDTFFFVVSTHTSSNFSVTETWDLYLQQWSYTDKPKCAHLRKKDMEESEEDVMNKRKKRVPDGTVCAAQYWCLQNPFTIDCLSAC